MPRTATPTTPAIRRLWLLAAALYLVVCATLDLFPRHGPPEFRYTGSDPAVAVWNLGWPIAQFIYDPRLGLQVGPTAWLVVDFQCLVFASGVAATLALRWFIRRRRIGRGFPVDAAS